MRWKPPSEDQDEIADLCQGILSFLADNPAAQDTLEGIAEWWLLERDLRREVDKVRRALARLVDEGLVVEKQALDGRSRYAVRRERLDDVRKLAETPPADP